MVFYLETSGSIFEESDPGTTTMCRDEEPLVVIFEGSEIPVYSLGHQDIERLKKWIAGNTEGVQDGKKFGPRVRNMVKFNWA
ncbi:hypothetical protein M514_02107, partial [Trichuris suis]